MSKEVSHQEGQGSHLPRTCTSKRQFDYEETFSEAEARELADDPKVDESGSGSRPFSILPLYPDTLLL